MREMEHMRVQWGGSEGKGERESQAGSLLRMEPSAELDPMTLRS